MPNIKYSLSILPRVYVHGCLESVSKLVTNQVDFVLHLRHNGFRFSLHLLHLGFDSLRFVANLPDNGHQIHQ